MKRFIFLKLGLLFLIVVGVGSCGSDEKEKMRLLEECEALADGGEVYLLEDSKDFIPYPEDVTKVIFSDSSGREYVGEVLEYKTELVEHESDITFSVGGIDHTIPCPLDSSIIIDEYRWRAERKDITITIDELDINLYVMTVPVVKISRDLELGVLSDECYFLIDGPKYLTSPIQNISFLVNKRSDFPLLGIKTVDFYENFELHDQTYENVYVADSLGGLHVLDSLNNVGQYLNRSFDLYYSSEIGIVGFRNYEEPFIDLKFVRWE